MEKGDYGDGMRFGSSAALTSVLFWIFYASLGEPRVFVMAHGADPRIVEQSCQEPS